MPDLDGATGWLNSPPLTTAGLRGQVVLVDFWTYTCVNWLRTPALPPGLGREVRRRRAGRAERAHPGVRLRADIDNVRRAVKDLRVDYPVAVDNDYAIWTAFANHYWAAL
jgi:hypothetical protein